MTTVPPTYINECNNSPKAGDFRSRAITNAEHPKCSSARSRRATIVSRNCTFSAPLPSTYKVLFLWDLLAGSGKSRITPSQTVPRPGDEIFTLLACGKAVIPECGNKVVRKSRAADDCLALMDEMLLPDPLKEDSGVGGGVASAEGPNETNLGPLNRESPEEKEEKGRDSTEELGVELGVVAPGVIGKGLVESDEIDLA